MRKIIAIGLIGITLTAVTGPARAGDEAAAFVLGTLVGGALADGGGGSRIYVNHDYPYRGTFDGSRAARAYAHGYRDASRHFRYAPPPKAYRYGHRHGRAYGTHHAWHDRGHGLPRPAAREIYRQGYRDARRDVRRAERHRERRETHWEYHHGSTRDRARDSSQGGRHSRHENRRPH